MKKTVALILGLCMFFCTYGVTLAEAASEIAFTLSSFAKTETGGRFGFSCVKSAFPAEIPQNTKIAFAGYCGDTLLKTDIRDFTEDIMYFNVAKEADRIALFAWDFATLKPLVSNYSLGIDIGTDDETEQKIQEIKGVVSGTYYTGLDAANVDIARNEIMIGTGEGKETYELASDLGKLIDFEDLIGKYVVAYYDKLDRQITSIQPRNNTSTIIKEQDVISINGDSIRYYDENGRTDSVSLLGYTKIYNGKYLENDHTIIQNIATEFRNGQIELVEGSGQKVAKITSYQVFVVNSFDKINEKIYFKYGKKYDNGSGLESFYQFPAATSSKPIIYVNGTKTEFSSLSLSTYGVINYMESPSVGGNIIKKMYVTKGAKTEKVTAGLGEERKVELNNKEMYLTNDYANYNTGDGGSTEEKAPFELGESYTYYLDYTGQIAAVKYSNISATYKYGYLVAAGEVSTEEYGARIISADTGTDIMYTFSSNVRIDGNIVKNSEVVDNLKITRKAITATYPNTSELAQPIRFSVSGATLKCIDTLSVGTGGTSDNFTKQINGDADSTVTKSSIKQGANSYSMLSSATKVLYVPDDVTDTTSYAKLTLDAAFRTSGTKRVEAFNVGSDKIAPFVIVYGASNPSHVFVATSPYMIVSKISHSGDSMTITGYKNASRTEGTITVNSEYYKGAAISGAISNYEDVSKGDLIRYIESNGKVVGIEIWYDADDSSRFDTLSNRVDDKSDTANSRYYRYGMVFAASDETGLVALSKYVPTDSASTEDKASATNATYFNCKSAKIYELDSDGNITVLDSLASINGYDETSNTARVAIMITLYNTAETESLIVYVVK